jgi:3-hydroxyacyl-CoA dehydrogenase
MQVQEIKKSLVVGAGAMGHSIALEYARAGVQVALNARHAESSRHWTSQVWTSWLISTRAGALNTRR